MTHAQQMSSLAAALVIALALGGLLCTPAFAGSAAPTQPHMAPVARPPQQDPTPTPPPPPDTVIQNIFNSIQFPFDSLVEALQNAIQVLLRSALAPLQTMFEAVLSLWLQNPGILNRGNAALPGWDLIREAWQFMYAIGIAFWPLTLAVIAAIAAKDAVAAATWGLGDLKQALGTWLVAVILCATSLWWMDLANQLANAITSYILSNFAGPQFVPGGFMMIFSAVIPGLFLAFPLAGIIIILFLLLLAITIFIGLTFAIIARLVLMYLLVALGPLAIILGVLPPLRFVTQLWTRGLLLVLVLGPVDALLLKMAFNVAQYASSAPVVQGAAAFIGVFGLLSILITINFAVVKGIFGAVIAVAQQTMAAVKTVGQMVVAGALLVSGAGAGAVVGGAASGTSVAGLGGGGNGGAGGAALGADGANGNGISQTKGSGMPLTPPDTIGGNGAGRAAWRPKGRGMAAAGSYLQSTRGPLAGFGALMRAAGMDRLSQERAGLLGAPNDAANMGQMPGLAGAVGAQAEENLDPGQWARGLGERESGSAPGNAGAAGAASSVAVSQLGRTNVVRPGSEGSSLKSGVQETSKQITGRGQAAGGTSSPNAAVSAPRAPGQDGATNLPPRRANLDSISQSRAAMGFDGTPPGERTGNAQRGGISSVSTPTDLEQDSAMQRANTRTAQAGWVASTGALPSSTSAAGSFREGALGSDSNLRATPESGDPFAAPNQPGNAAIEIAPSEISGSPAAAAFEASDHFGAAASESGMGINMSGMETEAFEPIHTGSVDMPNATQLLAPEADRTLSMLPVESEDARTRAAQLVSGYEPAEQGHVAAALEHAMRAANEQHGIGWSNMGEALERGLWSTQAASQNGIPLPEMARQMEPFSGTREPGDYLAWQLARGSEPFHLPSQQVAYLPAPGPYDYQAGRYVEQQLGGAVSYPEAAQLFYVVRDPAAPGGGWSKGHQFIGEVNRIASMPDGDALRELDRWMQTNAPTRARILWNIHFQGAKGES